MAIFPHPLTSDEDGILGIEGNLAPDTLLLAYHYGIFPWYNFNQPIIWWYPKDRFVMFPEKIYVSKTMAKIFKTNFFEFSINQFFPEVLENCASIHRKNQDGTWINNDMKKAFNKLFINGYGVSIEVLKEGKLVGGLYGVAIGKIFYGESMFSKMPNASKAAFIYLAVLLKEYEFTLIDCQQENPHLSALNAQFMDEKSFFDQLYNNRRYHMYEKPSISPLDNFTLLSGVSKLREKTIGGRL